MIQQSHLFNSVTNSVVISTFTFISHSTVPHIQQCHKFSCIIYFHVHISFHSPNIFNNETNSTVLSFLHHILFNSSMYSKVQQSQLSYLGLHSHLFQQSHLFNSVTNSVALSNFTFISHSTVPDIRQCHKLSCII